MVLHSDHRADRARSIVWRRARTADRDARTLLVNLDSVTASQLRGRIRHMLARDPAYSAGLSPQDVVQVADELVSNALRHGAAPRMCRITVLDGPCVRIEVDDASSLDPGVRPADSTGGLGLVLVGSLSSGWGVVHHTIGKTVWAELAAPPGASSQQ